MERMTYDQAVELAEWAAHDRVFALEDGLPADAAAEDLAAA